MVHVFLFELLEEKLTPYYNNQSPEVKIITEYFVEVIITIDHVLRI